MNKLYDIRDLEELWKHFTKHLSAMTSENLHSKSDIAAELAYRDSIIEKLNYEIKDYIIKIKSISYDNEMLNSEIYSLKCSVDDLKDEIESLNNLVDGLGCEANCIYEDSLISEINDLNNEILYLNDEITDLNNEISDLKEQILNLNYN